MSSLVPQDLAADLAPIAQELGRLHESVMWSAQGQFEQMKLWRSMNFLLGVPAATLAGVAGGTGLAARSHTATPAVLALLAAAFGAALTTLNPSRRMTQAQTAGAAYLEIQTALRQYLTIDLAVATRTDAREQLDKLTERRNEVNHTADPVSRYAYWRAKQNINAGGQTYSVDEGNS